MGMSTCELVEIGDFLEAFVVEVENVVEVPGGVVLLEVRFE